MVICSRTFSPFHNFLFVFFFLFSFVPPPPPTLLLLLLLLFCCCCCNTLPFHIFLKALFTSFCKMSSPSDFLFRLVFCFSFAKAIYSVSCTVCYICVLTPIRSMFFSQGYIFNNKNTHSFTAVVLAPLRTLTTQSHTFIKKHTINLYPHLPVTLIH